MSYKLIIVESPAKAKKLQSFLGKEYVVKASFGHIRELVKDNMGIDVKTFTPTYDISADKKKVVKELKELSKKASEVIIASDEDAEGEAIGWHLLQVLNLDLNSTKRIVFHEITKNAILEAIKKPRIVDMNIVNSQQTRRMLDRLLGFELSPILWKQIKAGLSAGRVQSIAVKFVVDKENEIKAFNSKGYYLVKGVFKYNKTKIFAGLDKNLENENQSTQFLNDCKVANYKIGDMSKTVVNKKPAPPFITSTLQQEAGKRYNLSAKQIMSIAQKLYEEGKITYHRTDSVTLSEFALNAIKTFIISKYGNEYSTITKYKTSSKNAQESHEAIRPTDINIEELGNNEDFSATEKKVYRLIWERTVASQMTPAKIERVELQILISNRDEKFIAKGETILFDGYLKLYKSVKENDDDSDNEDNNKNDTSIWKTIGKGVEVKMEEIRSEEKYTNSPGRYSEPTLIKKLESSGIGRPSTYASIISTILDRGYVVKESRNGEKKMVKVYLLKDNKIKETEKEILMEKEKNKLFPTDIGVIVNDFLNKNFENIMQYKFTSEMEKDLDKIADGKKEWKDALKFFYESFHPRVEEIEKLPKKADGGGFKEKNIYERCLGEHKEYGKNIYVKIGKYGPMLQMGENEDENKVFVSLKNNNMKEITFNEAVEMFKWPKILGQYDGKDVLLKNGQFGLYVQWGTVNVSLGELEEVNLENAIELIKKKQEGSKVLKELSKSVKIIQGKYGPCILSGTKFYRIPEGVKWEDLTSKLVKDIIEGDGKKMNKKK
jgi:DNA topoisomerase-1